MHLSRLMLTGTTILALTLLGGCSDDSETPEGDSSPTVAEDKGSAPAKSRDCKVDVTVSGAAQATWKAQGQSQVQKSQDPPAFYQASKGKDNISVYAEGEDFERSAVVTVDGEVYTTEQGAEGVEAQPNGKGATVDATAMGVQPDSQVTIDASFTC